MEKLNKSITIVAQEDLKGALEDSEIIINATSVGMFPNTEECVIGEEDFPEGKIVMDIVYNPIETKFLRFAEKKGCRIINGVDMFVYQGIEALKIWLNIEVEEGLTNIMRESVVWELKRKNN